MGGGNRHADHPRYGSIDPPEVIETDMRQMKRANMDLCRISHYPVSELLPDWADRNGLLIIEEGLNWSYPLRDYTVRCQVLGGAGEVLTMRTMALPLLRPGDHYTLNTTFKLASAARPAIVRIEVVRPTGFVTATQDLNIAP
jgi:hypothetical protein